MNSFIGLLLTGLASRSRKETHVFGPLEPEPEPLEEKSVAGAAPKTIGSRIRKTYAAPVPAPRRQKAKGNCAFVTLLYVK